MNTVSQVLERFIYHAKFGRDNPASNQTIVSYTYGGRVLIQHLGDVEIEEISKVKIIEMRRTLIDGGKTNGYMQRLLSQMRAMLRYAREEELLSVMDFKQIALPKKTGGVVEYLTNDEIKLILGKIDTNTIPGKRLLALCVLMLVTGMRVSEALAVNRTQIEEDKFQIIGKCKLPRTVFMNDWAKSITKKYLETRSDSNPALFVSSTNTNLRLTAKTAGKQFCVIARLAKLPKFKSGVLRKTFATGLHHSGVDIHDIAVYLGHVNLQHTKRYVGVNYLRLAKLHAHHVSYGV